MTAVASPRAGTDPAGARGASAAGGASRPGAGGLTPRRAAVLLVLAAMLLGGLGAFLTALSGPGRYESTATVVFTAGDEDSNISAGSRFVQNRTESWAAVAGSETVAARATAIDPAAASASITAVAPSGTEVLEVTASSDSEAAVPGVATAAAQAVIDVVVAGERYPGLPVSRVTGAVVDPGAEAVDGGMADARWWGVVGLVAGFVVGLGACTLLRPGRWARDVGRTRVTDRDRAVDLNARAMGDELSTLIRGLRSTPGRATVAVLLVSVAGYAATGSMVFPLLVVLAAGAWSWHTADPRWAVAALVYTGAGIFPEKVDVVRLGPVTPTVLEVSLAVAVIVAVRFTPRRPGTVFTGPVLAVTGALVVGSAVALLRGGEFAGMIDNARAVLVVLAFFPVYLAFGRRPHQLVATLLLIAGFCSSVIIVAAFTGLDRLVVNERSSVITGEETSSVARLSSPVLDLWAPLLIVLLSALVPRRPRWLWYGLVLIGVAHQALSFNRSTWVPLILLVVAVAAVTHGPRGVLKRAALLAVVGAIGLALAFGGLLGAQGRAIADRASSVVTGQAYGEDSLPDRYRENSAALITLRESPWVGTGVGQPYGGELLSYDSLHSRLVVDQRPYIHNQYLRIWLFMGVLGLLAYAFAGVRILGVTAQAWFRRAAGAPLVVATAMGLACLAAQAILQTTLVSRSAVLTTVTLMAVLAGFATWRPQADGPGTGGPRAREGDADGSTVASAGPTPTTPARAGTSGGESR